MSSTNDQDVIVVTVMIAVLRLRVVVIAGMTANLWAVVNRVAQVAARETQAVRRVNAASSAMIAGRVVIAGMTAVDFVRVTTATEVSATKLRRR